MRSVLEARYLSIEWAGPGQARKVEITPEPLEIERGPDDEFTVETFIFNGLYPWLGLRLTPENTNTTPVFISASGERHPMLPITDAQGVTWWVQNNGWDEARQRHLSELHRTMGRFVIEIDGETLYIENIVTGADKSVLDNYLRDFKDDLVWLVSGANTGATGAVNTGGLSIDPQLATALSAFASAARGILAAPARSFREVTTEQPVSRLRPNEATFRTYSRTPAALRLPGRGVEDTADIPDNRYLRHMIQVCMKLAKASLSASSAYAERFEQMARMEAQRSDEYANMKTIAVDPEIFDRQQKEDAEKLERISNFSGLADDNDGIVRSFAVELTNRYGNSRSQFFYKKLGATTQEEEQDREQHGVAYSVIQFPQGLADDVASAWNFCKRYTIIGTARIVRAETSGGKGYRLVTVQQVVSVQPHTSALEIKQTKRAQYEGNGWLRRLSVAERAEFGQEAKTAKLREVGYRDRSVKARKASANLEITAAQLKVLDAKAAQLKIVASPDFPAGMRYSQSPAYASCLAAYNQVQTIAQASGLSSESLDEIERIGVIHASALYERWCLVKILSVLIDDFGFLPGAKWQDRLVHAVTGKSESLALDIVRKDVGLMALLEIQPTLPNGRRPDFRLTFRASGESTTFDDPSRVEPTDRPQGLIMDAKFRAQWRAGELPSTVSDLKDTKNYAKYGGKVFILHPVSGSAFPRNSPLGWGSDSDYGQASPTNHRSGSVHLSSGADPRKASSHLRRLIAMEMQGALNAPEAPEEDGMLVGNSICIRCGTRHEAGSITEKYTRRELPYWVFTCSRCEMQTTRTHCYSCKRTLFKNGVQMTYHRTVADQITNVMCPECGGYFDTDWNNETDAFNNRLNVG